jgi:glutathione S-transferase
MLKHHEPFGLALFAKIDVTQARSITMSKPLLIIANKNYSSWSLRPYMALAMADIPFDEKLIHFGTPNFSAKIKRISKAGLVPILQHGDQVIWDTLAIMEYLAETWPKKNLWPYSKVARATARSMCAEMHSGFRALRNACPMNLRRPIKPVPMTDGIRADVARLQQAWSSARKAYGKGGPFLFGKFSIADAMFAPVVTRLETYAIPVSTSTRHYMNAVMATPAFHAWKAAALREKWIVPEDEVD